MAKKVAKKIVKIYRLPVYEYALENVLNMFMPDEQKHFEEMRVRARTWTSYLPESSELENIRRQKYEQRQRRRRRSFSILKRSTQNRLPAISEESATAEPDERGVACEKRKPSWSDLTWMYGMPESVASWKLQIKMIIAFWLKTGTVPAGECCLCHGKERAVTCIPYYRLIVNSETK